MDARLSAAPVVVEFAGAVKEWVDIVALYVAGSLAGGDYRPGVSDLDVVAVVNAPLDVSDRRRLQRRQAQFADQHPTAVGLHCIYVEIRRLADLSAAHPMWSDRRVRDRRLSEMSRVELVRTGITLHGPSPSAFFGQASGATLRSAARAELTGYWQNAVGKPSLWLSDWCVDLGLVTIARAAVALHEERLITKREAIDRLEHYGVPESLVHEIRQRRQGASRSRSFLHRVRRGRTARRLVARNIAELTEPRSARPANAGPVTPTP